MKTRKMGYSDYGFAPGEEKKLIKYCRRSDFAESLLLKDACRDSNECIADNLFFSIVYGMSYNKLTCKNYIPLSEVDFYAYRRKALGLFRKGLIERKEQYEIERKKGYGDYEGKEFNTGNSMP